MKRGIVSARFSAKLFGNIYINFSLQVNKECGPAAGGVRLMTTCNHLTHLFAASASLQEGERGGVSDRSGFKSLRYPFRPKEIGSDAWLLCLIKGGKSLLRCGRKGNKER